ncbi:MAG: hypothetical protein QM576_13310 [Rhodopseudomonas sp.]|uniref:His-rich protein BRANT n=1 Tax=unclassified Rhodopseudomonas TaxID=2638247 RepID=UPI0013E06527|nr:hypothetical protein [Rhodopseudomonas sp. BR0M22]MCD0416122.1 hypothetical protein [Rubrivivax sp. JA1024]NEW91416.1 hypothetical protein [Rhodopseudomonas sp. BR0M22]
MIKTVSAALVAVSMLAAPAFAASADKTPAAPATTQTAPAGNTAQAAPMQKQAGKHVQRQVGKHHVGKHHASKHRAKHQAMQAPAAKQHLSKASIRHITPKRG